MQKTENTEQRAEGTRDQGPVVGCQFGALGGAFSAGLAGLFGRKKKQPVVVHVETTVEFKPTDSQQEEMAEAVQCGRRRFREKNTRTRAWMNRELLPSLAIFAAFILAMPQAALGAPTVKDYQIDWGLTDPEVDADDLPVDDSAFVNISALASTAQGIFDWIDANWPDSLTISGTDEAVARLDGTDGLQDSLWFIDDAGVLSSAGSGARVALTALSATSTDAFRAAVNGDSTPRFTIDADGTITWGTGSGGYGPSLIATDQFTLRIGAGESFRITGGTTVDPSSPSEGQLYYRTDDDELKLYDGSDWVVLNDPNTTSAYFHLGDGEDGSSSSINCNSATQDTSNASMTTALSATTQTTQNFTTAAVTSWLELLWSFRRMSNQVVWSKDTLLFAPVQKTGDTAEAVVILRNSASSTESEGIESLTLHISDGSTVSTAAALQFSARDGTFRQFTTGPVDVSGYGDTLYWVLRIEGENVNVGSNASETVALDIHSVTVAQY